jgi:hypothetical protein
MSFFSEELQHPRALARFLYAQRVRGLEPPRFVGLDDEARDEFVRLLKVSKGYLEFGSGGSTIQAAELEIPTLSVEADSFFASAVRRALPPNASVEIIDIRIGLTGKWSRPIFTFPSRRRLTRWARYSSAPFVRLKQLGWFPDLVLVDGRFRRACALTCASEAYSYQGSINLLFDDYFNSDREHYRSVQQWLGAPTRLGRAALFKVGPGHSKQPSAGEIAEAAEDYQ